MPKLSRPVIGLVGCCAVNLLLWTTVLEFVKIKIRTCTFLLNADESLQNYKIRTLSLSFLFSSYIIYSPVFFSASSLIITPPPPLPPPLSCRKLTCRTVTARWPASCRTPSVGTVAPPCSSAALRPATTMPRPSPLWCLDNGTDICGHTVNASLERNLSYIQYMCERGSPFNSFSTCCHAFQQGSKPITFTLQK